MNDRRQMPYRFDDSDLDRMRENILRRTAAGSGRHGRRRDLVLALSAAAAVLLGIVSTRLFDKECSEYTGADLEQMLSTASHATLQEVAELNYDDIIYNQQL